MVPIGLCKYSGQENELNRDWRYVGYLIRTVVLLSLYLDPCLIFRSDGVVLKIHDCVQICSLYLRALRIDHSFNGCP
jgi:hypothetical protein